MTPEQINQMHHTSEQLVELFELCPESGKQRLSFAVSAISKTGSHALAFPFCRL